MKTPEQVAGTVEMVSVEWLLQNIHKSADGYTRNGTVAWPNLIRSKATDASFAQLVHTIEQRGFRVPICLYPNTDGADWALGNGHHRMTAAILMCLDEIPVFWSEYDYMSTTHTDTEGLLNHPHPWEFFELLNDVGLPQD